MKFYGRGIVWDKDENKILFSFDKDGQFETEDNELIEKILKLGLFKTDEKNELKGKKKK